MAANVFSAKGVHPVVIDAALLQAFGPSWLEWDPDGVADAVASVTGASVSGDCLAKITGLGVLHANHSYWEDWRAFEAVSWALSGVRHDLTEVHPLTPVVLCYSWVCAGYIDPKPELSEEVRAYAFVVFFDNGFSLLPDYMGKYQQQYLEKYPHLRKRSEEVKTALLQDKTPALEDAVAVELTRHKVLKTVITYTSSARSLQESAAHYGVADIVNQIVGV